MTAALTAARLSARAEMAKLDEPVVEALEALVDQVERSGSIDDHGHPLVNLKALSVARDALATRDAALKALP